jgi:hypothetical protein
MDVVLLAMPCILSSFKLNFHERRKLYGPNGFQFKPMVRAFRKFQHFCVVLQHENIPSDIPNPDADNAMSLKFEFSKTKHMLSHERDG